LYYLGKSAAAGAQQVLASRRGLDIDRKLKQRHSHHGTGLAQWSMAGLAMASTALARLKRCGGGNQRNVATKLTNCIQLGLYSRHWSHGGVNYVERT
jgi:hypothetical protein